MYESNVTTYKCVDLRLYNLDINLFDIFSGTMTKEVSYMISLPVHFHQARVLQRKLFC